MAFRKINDFVPSLLFLPILSLSSFSLSLAHTLLPASSLHFPSRRARVAQRKGAPVHLLENEPDQIFQENVIDSIISFHFRFSRLFKVEKPGKDWKGTERENMERERVESKRETLEKGERQKRQEKIHGRKDLTEGPKGEVRSE